jgi:hypothetical protein
MSITLADRITLLLPLSFLFACGTDDPTTPAAVIDQPMLSAVAYSEWSPPVNLGSAINSAANDQNATLSKDGLSLYFSSNRTGVFDIYVSRRGSLNDEWPPAEDLGSPVNSASADFAPSLSHDGHLLFFSSNRELAGNIDIYVSRRANTDNDLGWSEPVKLGLDVNTTDAEQAPMYLASSEDGSPNLLYFNRGSNAAGLSDIYSAAVKRDGQTLGPAEVVPGLSLQGVTDAGATVRRDGKEVFFFSLRSGNGALGGIDLWTSTRASLDDVWSTPVNLAELNTTTNEQTPSLSFDALTLVFASNRDGSQANDIWITTRTASGEE